MLMHKTLLDNADLNSHFILEIQLSKEEETKMDIPDELITGCRAKHACLFPEGEELAIIEAKAQDTRVGKKRRR